MTRTSRVLLALLVVAGASGATPAAIAAELRTETGLAGYELSAEAAPLRILIDDPSVPIPRPPDSPIAEATPSFTSTRLSTGPSARALASTLWPGALLGEALPLVAPGAPAYPFKAEASFPGGEPTGRQENGPSVTTASAQGLDVVATATTLASPAAEVVTLGSAESVSTSTVVDDVAISSTVASLTDVSVGGGAIRIASLKTTVEARSNGETMSSSGSSVVSGLTIAGMGFVVDGTGVRPVQGDQPGEPLLPALPGGALDPLTQLGITIVPPSQTETVSDTVVSRSAGGLRIILDSRRFNEVLSMLPLRDLVAMVPDESLRSQLFFLLASTPKITIILGAGDVSAAAAGLLDLGPLPELAALPPLLPPSSGSLPSSTGLGSEVLGGGALSSGGLGASPSVAGSPSGGGTGALPPPALAGADDLALFGGISPAVLLLGLLAAGLAARGLLALNALALGGGALARGCALGADGSLPDLREA